MISGKSEWWSQEIFIPYIQVWIWHLLDITTLLCPSSARSRKKRYALGWFSSRLLKGPGPSTVFRLRMKTKRKWGILVWCILITVFRLTDGTQYDEPSVGYGVASGSDQERVNWIDPSIGLQKNRSVWLSPYLNTKGNFSGLDTGKTKSFWLLLLMINEDSTRHWCFKPWRTVLPFIRNSYTSPYSL